MNLRTLRHALVALAALIGGMSAVSAPAQRIEFVDVTRQAGLPEDLFGLGLAVADLNDDGRPDLVIGIHSDTARNRVYLNRGLKRGVPRFEDVTSCVGFPAAVPVKCSHVEIQDFDNDGWPDVYFSAAWLDADGLNEKQPPRRSTRTWRPAATCTTCPGPTAAPSRTAPPSSSST